jgi:primosomal protein N'
LRGKEIWGVVKKIKEKPERGIRLQSILSLHKALTLREVELSFFEFLATQLVQSVSSLLYVALPTPPKRARTSPESTNTDAPSITLPKAETQMLSRIVKKLINQRECIVQVPELRRMAVLLAAYITHQQDNSVCVIVPTVRDARLLADYLSAFSPVVVTGDESNNERYQAYVQMRESSTPIVIGTKVASLMLNANFTSYFVLNSSHKHHKQQDRNPRFDARSVLWEFHERTQANIYFFDSQPRAIDVARFPKSGRLQWSTANPVHLVDMNLERQDVSTYILSLQAEERMQAALESGMRVLCVLNRKGASSGLICRACNERVRCPQCKEQTRARKHTMLCVSCTYEFPIPRQCGTCRRPNLKHLAVGIEGLRQLLSERFSGISIGTINKEKQTDTSAQLILATNFFLESFHNPLKPHSYGLVVMIDPDAAMYSSQRGSKESALRGVCVWRGVALSMKCDLLIQSSRVEFFSEYLSDPSMLLEEELKMSKRYKMPPYFVSIKVENRNQDRRKADLEIHALMRRIQANDEISVSEFKSKEDYPGLTIRTNTQQAQNLLPSFTELPDHYIIDIQGLL